MFQNINLGFPPFPINTLFTCSHASLQLLTHPTPNSRCNKNGEYNYLIIKEGLERVLSVFIFTMDSRRSSSFEVKRRHFLLTRKDVIKSDR